ncbi:hypothetical protein E1B28_001218 [Marasmius oreades]|uniref:Alginate lyase domain-containing protein n=1 Tax=Marasmius oreades TaxID=181124 RepID=A0A9P7V334_9AGAR|nr:uncharacterized protein E1B28_001218 [Marasmius oreades]KAG7099362.1 hypothetical protein E1B28_001218 [Marasmius oreades]
MNESLGAGHSLEVVGSSLHCYSAQSSLRWKQQRSLKSERRKIRGNLRHSSGVINKRTDLHSTTTIQAGPWYMLQSMMPITIQPFFYAFILLAFSFPTLADPSDWVNTNYVVSLAAQHGDSTTSEARSSITRLATSSAKNGPWSILDNNGIRAPSGDVRDYVSWAPYWWPDCNWCSSGGRNHLAHAGPEPTSSTDDDNQPTGDDDHPDEDYSEESSGFPTPERRSSLRLPGLGPHRRLVRVKRSFETSLTLSQTSASPTSEISESSAFPFSELGPLVQAPLENFPLQTQVPVSMTLTVSHSASERTAGTAAPAQHAAKTKKLSCTPSPTSSMPPSATWTTCPYVNKDGQVNPDTRRVKDPGHINNAGQSVLYNALTYALTRDSTYSKRVASFVNTLLLDSKTGMNPHADYGQIVRGPGPKGSSGSFTGVLDMRGLVKMYNGVGILRATQSPEWTLAMDQSLKEWTRNWTSWMTGSSLGKVAGTRPNNHCTFYTYQLAGAQHAIGDTRGAQQTIEHFIKTCFQNQISTSGEQPYEAVRTRPYHYRCFNLEALIGIAKIGDEIGMNVWTATTKYGANIKTATDFTMALDPKREDVLQIVPHVLAVARAYGDPTGKYADFLQNRYPQYRTKPYWFYNQPEAFPNAAGNRRVKRELAWAKDGDLSPANREVMPFTCPEVFQLEKCVKIELCICVTCDQLKQYYV